MNGQFRFFAERVNFGRMINLQMAKEDGFLGKTFVAQPVTVHSVASDEVAPPMIQMHPESAQSLIDELWNVGFRPTQGKQSEGQVDAIGSHLKDMRAIAFAQLRIEKP